MEIIECMKKGIMEERVTSNKECLQNLEKFVQLWIITPFTLTSSQLLYEMTQKENNKWMFLHVLPLCEHMQIFSVYLLFCVCVSAEFYTLD